MRPTKSCFALAFVILVVSGCAASERAPTGSDSGPLADAGSMGLDAGSMGLDAGSMGLDAGSGSDAAALPPRELACAPNELALAWSQTDDLTTLYAPVGIDLAPGGALFVRHDDLGGRVGRMRDGTPITPIVRPALDAGWTRALHIDPETGTANVQDIATGMTLRVIPQSTLREGWYATTFAALSGDGRTAMLLECTTAPATDDARATVRAIEVETGTEVRIDLDLACGETYVTPPALLPLDRERTLVVGLRELGPSSTDDGTPVAALGVVRVDFGRRDVLARFPSDPSVRAELRGPMTHVGSSDRIVDHALSEDGATFAMVARDGLLRRLSSMTLAPIADPLEVPLHAANHLTFVPSIESPIALTPRGSLFAHIAGERTVVIRDAMGAIAAELALPFAPDADGVFAPPMAMRFTGDGILVVTSHGVARFACGGSVAEIPRPDGELGVSAPFLPTARAHELVGFEIEVENARLPVVRWVQMAGTTSGSLERKVPAYAPAAGSVEIEIGADDGLRAARTRATLEVLPME